MYITPLVLFLFVSFIIVSCFFFFFFFFQAEDGIRDLYVTGVQTCALPISRDEPPAGDGPCRARGDGRVRRARPAPRLRAAPARVGKTTPTLAAAGGPRGLPAEAHDRLLRRPRP